MGPTCLGLSVVATPDVLQLAGVVVGWAGEAPSCLGAVPLDQRCSGRTGPHKSTIAPRASPGFCTSTPKTSTHTLNSRMVPKSLPRRTSTSVVALAAGGGGHYRSTSTSHQCCAGRAGQGMKTSITTHSGREGRADGDFSIHQASPKLFFSSFFSPNASIHQPSITFSITPGQGSTWWPFRCFPLHFIASEMDGGSCSHSSSACSGPEIIMILCYIFHQCGLGQY